MKAIKEEEEIINKMLNRGTNKLVDKDKLKIRVGEKTHEPNTGKSR